MAKLVSTRCPYWILAVLSLLHRGSNTSLTEPDLLGDGASKRIPRHCFLVTYDRKQLPVLNRFARVVRGFRTDTLAESRQGLPFATIATHGSLLRYTLVEGGIRSTVFADGYEFPCCPYILSKPFQIVSRGQGPTQHFAVTVDDRIPQEAGLGYGASYRTRLRFPPRVEHRNFFRWALPAIRGIHHLHANTSPSTHVNCTRSSSGLAGAALPGRSEGAHPHFRPVLCHGPCSAFSRPVRRLDRLCTPLGPGLVFKSVPGLHRVDAPPPMARTPHFLLCRFRGGCHTHLVMRFSCLISVWAAHAGDSVCGYHTKAVCLCLSQQFPSSLLCPHRTTRVWRLRRESSLASMCGSLQACERS